METAEAVKRGRNRIGTRNKVCEGCRTSWVGIEWYVTEVERANFTIHLWYGGAKGSSTCILAQCILAPQG